MMNWFEETGFKLGVFIAGCAGAVASFLKPQDLLWYERTLTIFAGGMSAMYLTPLAMVPIESIHRIGHAGELAAAYLIGYSGLKSIELAIVELKKRFKKK